MNIRVICPRCERVFKVDADLVGRKMLCPNRGCGDIFEVQPAGGDPTPPLPEAVDLVPMPGECNRPEGGPDRPSGQAGTVGDMVPILPAESVPVPVAELVGPHDGSVPTFTAELDEDAGAAGSAPKMKHWRNAPPHPGTEQRSSRAPEAGEGPGKTEKRRSKRGRVAPDTVKLPPGALSQAYPEATSDDPKSVDPRELAPGTWEAPPIRGGATVPAEHGETASDESAGEALPAPPAADDDLEKQFAEAARHRRKRRILIGGALLGGIAAAIAALILFGPGLLGKNEEQRYAHARDLYDHGKFTEAAKEFDDLAAIRDSEHHADYVFLAGLSHVRESLPRVNPDIPGASDTLRQLVVGHEKDPHVSQYGQDIWQVTRRLIGHYTGAAKSALTDKHANLGQVKNDLDQAGAWLSVSDRYPPQVVPGSERRRLEDELQAQDEGLAHATARQAALVQASDLKLFPATAAGVQKLEAWLRQKGYAEDDDFQAVFQALQRRVLQAVQYVSLHRPPASRLPADDPGLVVGVPMAKTLASDRAPVTFAVARGVLYALRAEDLSLLWFTRVGPDTTRPPVRLPRDSVRQAVLVLSSERNTLTARELYTGHVLWSQTLGTHPCVAWPLVLDRLAYVPTTDGVVHVIETNEGYEVGQYQLGGMQLDLGGVPQPGTDLVYFAGNHDNIYVLNIKTHTCVGILSTHHGAKTLEGAPVIVSRADARAALGKSNQELPDYLVLTIQAEGGTRMRVLRLAVAKEKVTATEEPVDVTIPGFASFPPYSDPEKMVQVTDAAQAAILGIGQPGNSDPPLFEQSINSVLRQGTRRQAELCQVVYARENDFWILANGELQRWHYDLFRQQLTPVWDAPLILGEPLHAAEASPDGQVLDVVTQAVPQETCLVTAVAAGSGKVLTRRQIGFMSQGEPLVLSNGQVAALDRGGSLFVFKPAAQSKGEGGLSTGQMLGGPVAVSGSASYLLPARDGRSALQITAVQRGAEQAGKNYQLLIRRYTPGQPLTEMSMDLGAWQLAGPPGIERDSIVVPLSSSTGSGILRRYSLADGSSREGPNWRPGQAVPGGTCYAVALADGDILFADRDAELKHAAWPIGDAGYHMTQVQMPAPITAPLLLFPVDAKHPGPRVLATDSNKEVVLLEGPKLQVKRRWNLKAGQRVTAAPYLSGGYLACVMDEHTLVWLNPNEEAVRSYQLKDQESKIVGRPQVIQGMFVVADDGGQFVGIDAASGKVHEGGYALQATFPLAAPVALGTEQLMAPLGDGTVFLLPLEKIKK